MMYADKVTDSMQWAINETNRRRGIQTEFNEEHGIDPQTIRKKVTDILGLLQDTDSPRPIAECGEVRRPCSARSRHGRSASTHPEPRRRNARGRYRATFRIRGPGSVTRSTNSNVNYVRLRRRFARYGPIDTGCWRLVDIVCG